MVHATTMVMSMLQMLDMSQLKLVSGALVQLAMAPDRGTDTETCYRWQSWPVSASPSLLSENRESTTALLPGCLLHCCWSNALLIPDLNRLMLVGALITVCAMFPDTNSRLFLGLPKHNSGSCLGGLAAIAKESRDQPHQNLSAHCCT